MQTHWVMQTFTMNSGSLPVHHWNDCREGNTHLSITMGTVVTSQTLKGSRGCPRVPQLDGTGSALKALLTLKC